MSVDAPARVFPDGTDEATLRDYIADIERRSAEPVLLALYYQPNIASNDLWLFEIVDQYGFNEVGPPGDDLFDMEYGYLPGENVPGSRHLHVVLTNPVESRVAVEKRWPKMLEVQQAVISGKYVVIKSTPDGADLLSLIKAI